MISHNLPTCAKAGKRYLLFYGIFYNGIWIYKEPTLWQINPGGKGKVKDLDKLDNFVVPAKEVQNPTPNEYNPHPKEADYSRTAEFFYRGLLLADF